MQEQQDRLDGLVSQQQMLNGRLHEKDEELKKLKSNLKKQENQQSAIEEWKTKYAKLESDLSW